MTDAQHTSRSLLWQALALTYRVSGRMLSVAIRVLPSRLRKRLRKTRKRLSRPVRLAKSLGWWALPASRQLARAEAEEGSEVLIPVGAKRFLTVRAGTTDTNVFRQHFIKRELYAIRELTSVEVIVDLGSHIGVATEVFRRLYPGSRIFSVEMDPENAVLCARNHSGTVGQETVQAAIWSSSGTTWIRDVGEGNFALRASGVATGGPTAVERSVAVPALSFQDFVREHSIDRISILKIDIEGSEAELLESAWSQIFDMTDLVVMEIHDWIPNVRERVEAVLTVAADEFEFERSQSGEFTCLKSARRSSTLTNADQAVNA